MPSLAWHAIVCPSFPVSFSTRVKYRSSICVQCPLSVPAYVSAGPTCSTQGYGERAIWASSRSGRLTARWCGSIRAERPDRSRTWHCGKPGATPRSPQQLLQGCVVMMPSQILGAILLAMVISAAGAWQVLDLRMCEKLAEHEGLYSDDLAAISNADAPRLAPNSTSACPAKAAHNPGPTTHQGIIRRPAQPSSPA